ncbi:MAG: signal recognition particle receptor subunit alpha, partial [Actinomycetes bacterium]
MDLTTLWYLIGAIVVTALVLVGLVVGVRRRAISQGRRPGELPRPMDTRPREPAQDAGDSPTSFVDVLPRAGTSVEVEHPDLVDGRLGWSGVEAPESAQSRLQRLRARLAGSNNVLGRSLLLLISRDRLDEDTWEDFEDTLLTSDLGVAPTTELTEALRHRLRVEGVSGPARAKAVLR